MMAGPTCPLAGTFSHLVKMPRRLIKHDESLMRAATTRSRSGDAKASRWQFNFVTSARCILQHLAVIRSGAAGERRDWGWMSARGVQIGQYLDGDGI
ncbi:hypothetical protein Zmor_008153 [Zophobas morio]|uniref:Uncharacterized protein n=1 Tax=Zophobas morio TaxID=2755281 RepID=A0AA38MQE6_9CUCU|nr:hypothetical protein Zmor_008153 [Zophobas morio]